MKCKNCGEEIYKAKDGQCFHDLGRKHCLADTVATPEQPPEPEYEELTLFWCADGILKHRKSRIVAAAFQSHKRFAGYRYEHEAWDGPRYCTIPVLLMSEEGSVLVPEASICDGAKILHPVAVRLRRE